MTTARFTCSLVATSVIATSLIAQTAEQRLDQCMKTKIEAYQPASLYSQEFKCSVGNKKGPKTPKKGPIPAEINYPGHVILSAHARETYKISNGGHTPPIISLRRDKVSISFWCSAEDKPFGKSGKYNVLLDGTRKRVATGQEWRRVLTDCSRSVDGEWN